MEQPTPGPDTRSPRGGLKDAIGGAADGGRTAPGPAEGLNVGVGVSAGAMGASNGAKESSGVNGSGVPRVNGRWVVSCFVCGLWECLFYYRRRRKVLLWGLEREREGGANGGGTSGAGGSGAGAGAAGAGNASTKSGGADVFRLSCDVDVIVEEGAVGWVVVFLSLFLSLLTMYLQVPERYLTLVDWCTPRWCVVFLLWLCLSTCKRLD
jgi:hypothetical protein